MQNHLLHSFVDLFQNLPKSLSICFQNIPNDTITKSANSLEPCFKIFNALSVTSSYHSMFMKTSFQLLSPMKSPLGKCRLFRVIGAVTWVHLPHDQTRSGPHEVRWGVPKWFKLTC